MSLVSPQLEAFMAVADNASVHGAAQQLFLTQTAVTQRIRTLERNLETCLFVRTRRGMTLTAEGEALLRYCQNTKALAGNTLAQIKGLATDSEVRLSIIGATSIMRARVVPNCLAVMQDFPKLLLHFDVSDEDDLFQYLRSGKRDIAILPQEQCVPDLEHKPLAPEKYVLVCSSQWRGRKLKDIVRSERVVDFNPSDTVTQRYLEEYDLLDLMHPSRYFVNRTESLAWMVAQGIGYSTLPREFAKPYIDSGELIVLNQGKALDLHYVLAWYKRPEAARYFASLIDAIK